MNRKADFQQTLASQSGFEKYGRKSRREEFLGLMESVVPWRVLPQGGQRSPAGGPADHAAGVLLAAVVQSVRSRRRRRVVRVANTAAVCGRGPGPRPGAGRDNHSSFSPSVETHALWGQILDTVNHYLAGRGLRISTGAIVDATIIAAPSSTKNEKRERDPEMHQTRKGNEWHFGMKAHIGVDSKEVIVHSVCTSAASVSENLFQKMFPRPLHPRILQLSKVLQGTVHVPISPPLSRSAYSD